MQDNRKHSPWRGRLLGCAAVIGAVAFAPAAYSGGLLGGGDSGGLLGGGLLGGGDSGGLLGGGGLLGTGIGAEGGLLGTGLLSGSSGSSSGGTTSGGTTSGGTASSGGSSGGGGLLGGATGGLLGDGGLVDNVTDSLLGSDGLVGGLTGGLLGGSSGATGGTGGGTWDPGKGTLDPLAGNQGLVNGLGQSGLFAEGTVLAPVGEVGKDLLDTLLGSPSQAGVLGLVANRNQGLVGNLLGDVDITLPGIVSVTNTGPDGATRVTALDALNGGTPVANVGLGRNIGGGDANLTVNGLAEIQADLTGNHTGVTASASVLGLDALDTGNVLAGPRTASSGGTTSGGTTSGGTTSGGTTSGGTTSGGTTSGGTTSGGTTSGGTTSGGTTSGGTSSGGAGMASASDGAARSITYCERVLAAPQQYSQENISVCRLVYSRL